jgi:hypothetical protein
MPTPLHPQIIIQKNVTIIIQKINKNLKLTCLTPIKRR